MHSGFVLDFFFFFYIIFFIFDRQLGKIICSGRAYMEPASFINTRGTFLSEAQGL